MTVRICLKTNKATYLDNVIMRRGDIVSFNDVSELDPPLPERIALLKLCGMNEVVGGLGMRIDEHTYVVQEK